MQEKSKYKKFNDNVARGLLTPGDAYKTPTGDTVVVTYRHGKKWKATTANRVIGCFWPSELSPVRS